MNTPQIGSITCQKSHTQSKKQQDAAFPNCPQIVWGVPSLPSKRMEGGALGGNTAERCPVFSEGNKQHPLIFYQAQLNNHALWKCINCHGPTLFSRGEAKWGDAVGQYTKAVILFALLSFLQDDCLADPVFHALAHFDVQGKGVVPMPLNKYLYKIDINYFDYFPQSVEPIQLSVNRQWLNIVLPAPNNTMRSNKNLFKAGFSTLDRTLPCISRDRHYVSQM